MNFSFSFLLTALAAASAKIPVTLLLSTAPMLAGCAIGLGIALVRFFRLPVLAFLFRWGVTIVKGIPVVLILLVFYVWTAVFYEPVMGFFGVTAAFKNLNKALIAIAALSVYAVVGLSEAFRGGLAAVRKGQFDAAFAAGLDLRQTLLRVILPQALPASLPMMGNIFIALTKAAALASMVSVIDVMNAAVISANNNYRFLEAYIAAALIYWMICIIIEKLFFALEKYFAGKTGNVHG
ncbi:MAG: amino acid ABC transporter permease [Treponema sp.]|jgi:L-cystine transport system permease protein|nr:amino acid ABC transporter permease [Treponema sp.]